MLLYVMLVMQGIHGARLVAIWYQKGIAPSNPLEKQILLQTKVHIIFSDAQECKKRSRIMFLGVFWFSFLSVLSKV